MTTLGDAQGRLSVETRLRRFRLQACFRFQNFQPLPPLGFTDIFALVKQKLMQVEGDIHPFMANLLYFKDVIAAPRRIKQKEAAR